MSLKLLSTKWRHWEQNFSLDSKKLSLILSFIHLCLLSLSNILVQYPFPFFGFQTTWGAFTYPCIFIVTDLTVRTTSSEFARRIVLKTLIPGLIISYLVASQVEGSVLIYHPIPMRISLACLIAYLSGQFLDICVFQKLRAERKWWLAPFISNTVGNIVDTLVFFSFAFYHSSNLFLSQHWPEIASVDLGIKLIISCFAFLPIYGLCLKVLLQHLNLDKNQSKI
jgi:uncharacterized integral membrane protein (TIGR00697 family)